MPRGGYREGAGGKSKWKHGKTKVIRVPEALADQVLKYARKIDRLDSKPVLSTSVTTSKVINLTGISTYSFEKGSGIYLADLITKGYQLKPDILHDSVINKSRTRQQLRASKLKDDISKEIENLKSKNE